MEEKQKEREWRQKDIRASLDEITMLRDILETGPMKSFYKLIDLLQQESVDYQLISVGYHQFLYELIRYPMEQITGDRWKDFILNFLFEKENPLSVDPERVEDRMLTAAMARDLDTFERIFSVNGSMIKKWCEERVSGSDAERIHGWLDWTVEKREPVKSSSPLFEAKRKMAETKGWGQAIHELLNFHKQYGWGDFLKYRAFRWDAVGGLEGVDHVDPIHMEDLIGYEAQKEELLNNTRRFLSDQPANNILLYGDRGTGKSSMVKALIHSFEKSPLRLVELGRDAIQHYLTVINLLRKQPLKFILFIDDLSFEENETEYKSLKALLEGGITAAPPNVIVYATSNRRHLVKESFKDRGPEHLYDGEEEIYRGDAIQEKLSLVDRFGMTLTFLAPDKQQYLDMIDSMLKQKGMFMDRKELEAYANRWEMRFNGKSGRSARQLANNLLY